MPPSQTLHDLMAYVKDQLPCRRHFLVDEGVRGFAQATVDRMEKVLLTPGRKVVVAETVQVPLAQLIWHGKSKGAPQPPAEPGARVVNIAPVGPVPFGEAGTVISADPVEGVYSVMLDNPAQFGTLLRNRLQSKRGYVAHAADLLFI
jgi:hypothetical protein